LAADQSLSSMCHGLAEPSSWQARTSSGQCQKFCSIHHLLQCPNTE